MRNHLFSIFSLTLLLGAGSANAQIIDHSNPSINNNDMVANQSYNWGPIFLGGICRLTDKGSSETGTIFSKERVDITQFETSFVFQILCGGPGDASDGTGNCADGMTFVIQNQGVDALGAPGGSMGYAGITKSVAVKFDTVPNPWDGNPDPSASSTGLYSGGEIPAGGYDLLRDKINLRSQHLFRVDMRYDGRELNVRIADQETNAVSAQSYSVDIPKRVGGATAFIGFTAATGLGTASHDLHRWYFASTPPQSRRVGASLRHKNKGPFSSGVTVAAWPTVTEHPAKATASRPPAKIRVSSAE